MYGRNPRNPQYVRLPAKGGQDSSGGGDAGLAPAAIVFLAVVIGVIWIANTLGVIHLDNLSNGPGMSSGGSGGGGDKGGGKASSSDSQAILNEALKYDSMPYIWGGGHPPTEKGGVDCSGLINVAVMKATGIKEDQLAESFRRSKHWFAIPMKDARAGDIMYDLRDPGDSTDHVVLVVDNPSDGKLHIFEARTRRGPLADQIRHSYNQKYSRFDGALRFRR